MSKIMDTQNCFHCLDVTEINDYVLLHRANQNSVTIWHIMILKNPEQPLILKAIWFLENESIA
jgi:hypothetical protein